MNLRRATLVILSTVYLNSPIYAQIPLRDLERVEGAWECVDSDGVHGIFLTSNTYSDSYGQTAQISRQTINILVYRRLHGQSQGGTFTVGSSDKYGGAAFDGKLLSIHLNGQPPVSRATSPPHLPFFEMEIAFDRDADRWTGAWSLCKRNGGALLERPAAGGAGKPSAFVGDWEGRVDPTAPFVGGGSLHIRQSADGTLMGWIDRTRSSTRNVGRLLVEPISDKSVVIRFANGSYDAVLSNDGRNLSGQWLEENNLGPSFTSSNPTRYFRRD
jgi:hypothetical protein